MEIGYATPVRKNLFGETIYKVNEGVRIRTYKKTEDSDGNEM